VVNFVGTDGLVDRSPKLRECPAFHLHLRTQMSERMWAEHYGEERAETAEAVAGS
jgi:hypothetical protein